MPPNPVPPNPVPPEHADLPSLFTAAVPRIAEHLGLSAAGTRMLRIHASGNFLLPDAGVVVRVTRPTEDNHRRTLAALQVTTWLHAQGFPCVTPTHPDPVTIAGVLASLWHYLPQPTTPPQPPPVAVLGALLHQLHQMPAPPVHLPLADPLRRLRLAIATDAARVTPILTPADRDYLTGRINDLQGRYDALHFPLGFGLIHGDAHTGNLLTDPTAPLGYALADWDGTSWGPREIDLVLRGAPATRFHTPSEQRLAFTTAYGYDLAAWPHWPILTSIREIHSLAGHLQAASDKPSAATEVRKRLHTLTTGDTATWAAVG